MATFGSFSEQQTDTFVDPLIRLYEGVFGRKPDLDGLNFWINSYKSLVEQNPSQPTIDSLVKTASFWLEPTITINGQTQLTEFGLRFGVNSTNENFLNLLYQNVLGRSPDAEGLQHWLDLLNAGTLSRQEVVVYFTEFVEFVARAEPYINAYLEGIAAGTESFLGSLFGNNGSTGNHAPTAGDDTITISEDATATEISALLLKNDSDPDPADALFIASVHTEGTQGTVQLGSLFYNPAGKFEHLAAGQTATDTFSYTVSDGRGGQDTATVTVTIQGANEQSSDGLGIPAILLPSVQVEESAFEDDSAFASYLLGDYTGPDAVFAVVNVGGLIFPDAVTFDGNRSLIVDPGADYFQYLSEGEILTINVTYDILVGGAIFPKTATITITGVNDAPVITSNGGSSEITVFVPENTTSVTDVDSTDAENDTLTYSIVGGADSTKFTIDPNSGVLSFLAAPNFEVPTDIGTNNVYDVIVEVSDPLGATDTQAIAVAVTDVNEAPAVDLNGGTAGINTLVVFTEADHQGFGDTDGVLLSPSGTLDDVDGGDNVETVIFTLTNDQDGALERLFVDDTPALTGVTVGGNGTDTLTLTRTGTEANLQAAMRLVRYQNDSDQPTEITDRVINVVASDGSLNSPTALATITVAASNDAPVVDLNGGTAGINITAAFVEATHQGFGDTNGVIIAPSGTLNDVDTDLIDTVTFTLTNDQDGVLEQLFVDNTPALTGVTVGGNGTDTLTLTRTGTEADLQAAMQLVRYQNNSDQPNTTSRIVNVVANDGALNSTTAIATITVEASNDAPVVDLNGGTAGINITAAFVEATHQGFGDTNGVIIAPSGTLNDVDTDLIDTVTFTLTNDQDGALEQLFVDNTPALTGVTVTGNGTDTLTLTRTGTEADLQAAMQLVRYQNNSDTPNTTSRIINVVAYDGTANSTTAVATVSVTASDDAALVAPTLTTAAIFSSNNITFTVAHATDPTLEYAFPFTAFGTPNNGSLTTFNVTQGTETEGPLAVVSGLLGVDIAYLGIGSSVGETLTNSAYINVIVALYGFGGNDTLTAASVAYPFSVLRGGGGVDTINLSTGRDIVVFNEATGGSANGDDTISSFAASAGGDVLNFREFLGTGAWGMEQDGTAFNGPITPFLTTDTAARDASGKVVLLKGTALTDVDAAAEITAEFIAGQAFANLANMARSVVLSGADGSTTIHVWMVVGNSSGTETTTHVGTMTLTAGQDIDNLHENNFDFGSRFAFGTSSVDTFGLNQDGSNDDVSIYNFTAGAGGDVLQLDLSALDNPTNSIIAGDGDTVGAADAISIEFVTTTGAQTLDADDNIFVFTSGTFANTTAGKDALIDLHVSGTANEIQFAAGGAGLADNNDIIIVWSDGIDAYVGVWNLDESGTANELDAAGNVAADITTIATLQGLSTLAGLTAANFDFVP